MKSSSLPLVDRDAQIPEQAQQQRARRLFSAWITLVPSKVVTLLVQVIAIPTVYRAIGAKQFSAYAAITAAVSIFGFLNLGMGGAIVTPLAQAAAAQDRQSQARLLGATLIPMGIVTVFALCVAVPLLFMLPIGALFGLAATTTPPTVLRAATVIACIGTLAAIPLSVLDSARQAYQETHISNLFGTMTNAVMGLGLVLVARFEPSLSAFVAVTALSPLAVRLLNAALLFASRPYLMTLQVGPGSMHLMRRLAGDGISYMGAAAIANILVYQWPVYYIARVRPPAESSSFAVYVQFTLLVLSFGVSLAQPLWPAVADAAARADYTWISRVIRRARTLSLMYGATAAMGLGLGMNALLRIWLRRPIYEAPVLCWLAGLYVLMAMWEYIHWPLTLGLGGMKAASNLVFIRALVFAIFIPIVAKYGQVGIMVLMSAAILASSAWRYPQLLRRCYRQHVEKQDAWVTAEQV